MTLVEIFYLIGLGCLLLAGIFGFIFSKTDNEVIAWITVAFIALFPLFMFAGLLRNTIFKTLPEKYQERVCAVEEAEKNLQKFLIDHPEFREVE